MSIFKEIKNSISNPDYYRSLVDESFGKSLKYYSALVLIVSIMVTIVGSILVVPVLNRLAFDLKETVLSSYPDDLQVSVEKGTVKTNVKEPYAISIPNQYKDTVLGKKNLVVFDTTSSGDSKDLAEYQTFVLVGKDQVTYEEGPAIGSNVVTKVLDKDFNLVLDKLSITKFFDTIEPLYKYVTPLIVLGIFMMVVLVMLGAMLYLLFIALLVWLIALLNKWKISYLKAYQLSLHFATIGFIVAWAGILIFPAWILVVLLISTIILLSLVTFITAQIRQKN